VAEKGNVPSVNASVCVRPIDLGDMSYVLDRDNVFRIPFSANGVARMMLKEPLKGIRLAVRTETLPCALEWDGRRIAPSKPCTSLPVEFRPLYAETDAMDLAAGEHVIRLASGGPDDNCFLPAAFVVGRFAANGKELTHLPRTLSTASLVRQGLSGYCGTVTYVFDGMKRLDGADGLRLDAGNAFARVKWNGSDLGGCGWAPYEWRLPADAAKTGRLEVTIFTSVRNIFGERDRTDMIWNADFWNPQHDADSSPTLKFITWLSL